MITIVENFLDKKYQDHLHNLIVNGDMPLYWSSQTYYSQPNNVGVIDPNTKDSFQLIHHLVSAGQPKSSFWPLFNPISILLMAKTGIGFEMEFTRAKLNVNPCRPDYKENQYFIPHIDVGLKQEGFTAIYYMNDADGDTLFFESPKEDGYGHGQIEVPYNLKVIESVRPKKGTLIYFDNQILHAGKPPKKSSFRALINFNWTKNK